MVAETCVSQKYHSSRYCWGLSIVPLHLIDPLGLFVFNPGSGFSIFSRYDQWSYWKRREKTNPVFLKSWVISAKYEKRNWYRMLQAYIKLKHFLISAIHSKNLPSKSRVCIPFPMGTLKLCTRKQIISSMMIMMVVVVTTVISKMIHHFHSFREWGMLVDIRLDTKRFTLLSFEIKVFG